MGAASKSVWYVYDPFGNLIQTTDAQHNVIAASFDVRGQRIQLNDPDLGVRNYVYNAFGELVSQTDAKGQETKFSYDVLGRVLTSTDCTALCSVPGAVEMVTTTVYDTATMGKGKPAAVSTSLGYLQTYEYDSLGRPSASQETLQSGVSGSSELTTYGAYGRVASTRTASGQTFTYAYTDLGFMYGIGNAAGGGSVIFRVEEVEADGAVTREIYGNGVVTTRVIDPVKGVVTAIESKKDSTVVQSLAYQYDGFLNMTRRDDLKSKVRETFTFDTLNRLTASVATRYNVTPEVTYDTQSVSYDIGGNITSKADVGAYSYGGGGAGPHAVTSITPGGTLGTTSASFTYDANGNMLSGNGRTFTWTSFDMPASITRGTASIAFTYGAGHQRIKQVKGANAETIYYFGGGGTERVTDASGTRWIDYISVGGRLIGSLTVADGAGSSPSGMAYFHTDHLGSIERITDWQGTTTETLDFDAWGKRRYPSGAFDPNGTITSSVRRGFTGHEQLDTVGLVHMNGRVYDPLLARFISADTVIQAPLNLQNYNRYSYVLNNPLSYTDPSGHFFKFLKKAFKAIGKFFKGFAKFVFSRQGLAIAVGIALSVYLGPGAFGIAGLGLTGSGFAGGMAAAAIGGAAAGAISTGTLKGAMIGAVSAAVTYGIGHGVFPTPTPDASGVVAADPFVERGLAHGVAQGTIAEVSGGDFRSGFMGAAFASVAGSTLLNGIPARSMARAVTEMMVGGTAAVVGGGKFANGAYSAAFVWGFNAAGATCPPEQGGGEWKWGWRETLMHMGVMGKTIGLGLELSDAISDSMSRKTPFAFSRMEYLDGFAAEVGAETFRNYPNEHWTMIATEKILDPNVQIHFNLNGLGDPYSAVSRGSLGPFTVSGNATNWELYQVYSNPQIWDKVQFWRYDGITNERVGNPFIDIGD